MEDRTGGMAHLGKCLLCTGVGGETLVVISSSYVKSQVGHTELER